MMPAFHDQASLHSAFLPLGQGPHLQDALRSAGHLPSDATGVALQAGPLRFKAYKRATAWHQAHARVCYRVRSPGDAGQRQESILHGWARLRNTDPVSNAPIQLTLGDLDLSLWRFPQDAALPGLTEVFGLSCAGHDSPPEVVSYRPGVRAVLRFEQCGVAPVTYAKTYAAADLARQVYERCKRIYALYGSGGRFGSAAPLGIDRSTATVWHHGVTGTSLPETLGDTYDSALAQDILGALVNLHGLQHPALPRVQAGDLLTDALKKADRLRCVRPELGADMDRIRADLLAGADVSAGRPEVSLHGDFHLRQWLRSTDRVTLCDFDELCTGAPEIDLASLLMDLSLYHLTPATLQSWLTGITGGYAALAPWGVRIETLRWHLKVQTINKMHRAYVQLHPDLTGECRRYLAHLATVTDHIRLP